MGIGGRLVKPMGNLVFLPAGRTPPNPAELLGSRRMNNVLSELSAGADVVVIDTPPLLPVADAAIVAAQVDGVILVVALNKTREDTARRAVAILAGYQRPHPGRRRQQGAAGVRALLLQRLQRRAGRPRLRGQRDGRPDQASAAVRRTAGSAPTGRGLVGAPAAEDGGHRAGEDPEVEE